MSEEQPDGVVMKVVNGILDHGVDGLGPLCGSDKLAQEYLLDEGYSDTAARVEALIRWEASKNFGSGFLTGLGGLVTLPASVPASLYASWFIQARLAGAIAVLHGHPTTEDRVRTLILLSLLGDAGKEILKDVGVKVANRVAMNAVKAIPGKVLIEINKKVGFRLITKAGEKGIINLTKAVPVVGGVVGGTIDAAGCVTAGRAADAIFRPAAEPEPEEAVG